MAELVKPGWKTSEFWLVVATNVIGMIIQFDVIPAENPAFKIVAFIAQILATMGYTYSRTQVKK